VIKFFVLLFIFSSSAFAGAKMQIDLSSAVVKQGSLVDAVVRLDGASVQQIELQKLKGVSLADTIYLHQVAPLIRSGEVFEADAKIIFLKVPEGKPLTHKIGENDISITWSDVEVQPTEAPAQLLFGQFEIPGRKRILEILAGFLILGLVAFGVYRLNQIRKKKSALLRIRADLRDKIMSAREYQDVVTLWQQKSDLLKEFPHLSDPFKELEKVLFKYQFKQSQSETEKAEVMKAYRDFMTKVQGGFNGI
jgi:hypothetical protein